MRHFLFLVAIFAITPLMSAAETTVINCQSAPQPTSLYDPSAAQDSLPAVVRNVLPSDPSAFTPGLDFTVLIPAEMTPGCPAGSLEPMRDIRYLGEGRFAGIVVANSRSFHAHLFGQTITFTWEQVWDWQFASPDTNGRLYGAYRTRSNLARLGGGDATALNLMPDAVPSNWR